MEPEYREIAPPAGLQAVVACTWEQTPHEDRLQRIVPDACVDLVWLADRRLVIAGPDTSAHDAVLPAGSRTSAIRLRPGAAGAVLGLPASELRDREVAAVEVWGAAAARLEEALVAAAHHERPALLSAAVTARGGEPDRLVVAAARLFARPGARVDSAAGGWA